MTLIRNAVKTGMKVADDVLEGKYVKESAKKRVLSGIKRTADQVNWQMGYGIRKRRWYIRDIFS